MGSRVYGKNIAVDKEAIQEFYYDRSRKFSKEAPYVSVLFQDLNPELARRRDQFEKELVLPILNASKNDRVLDVGCGVGRWAEVLLDKVKMYHGTDPCAPLIEIALDRFRDNESASFQTIAAQDGSPTRLDRQPPFSLVLLAGVLQYLDDEDCIESLRHIALCSGDAARIYIRIPIGIAERMTLDRHWSDELEHEYSAIYRTREEYLQMINSILVPAGFTVDVDQPLYPSDLNNRTETRQHIFILSKGGG